MRRRTGLPEGARADKEPCLPATIRIQQTTVGGGERDERLEGLNEAGCPVVNLQGNPELRAHPKKGGNTG